MNQLSNKFFEILKLINESGLSKKIAVIGSWAYWLYHNYYFNQKLSTEKLMTTDADLFVSRKKSIKSEIDIIELMKKYGYNWHKDKQTGIDKFEKDDFLIEFLTEMKGLGAAIKGFEIKNLGITAIPIRYMSLLSDNFIFINVDKFKVMVPDPCDYGLHKLIVAQLRSTKTERDIAKKNKDISHGVGIINNLKNFNKVTKKFSSLPKKWKQKILISLEESGNKFLAVKLNKS